MGGGAQLRRPPPDPAEEDTVLKGPRVVWELWDGNRWADLLPEDLTYGFTRSGYVSFDGPKQLEKRNVFDTEAYWLRARLETGAYDLPPALKAVLVNAVSALNGVTLEEIVGSSDGSIDQSFTVANVPFLAGPELGVQGNVGANALTVLKQSIAFVQGVTNPFAASGGADPETVEEAKRRGTYAIKNRDRAITAEDYEQLALAASRRVARAKCVQASDGSISLLLVPKAERESGEAKLVPSRDLIDRVAAFIDKRRLIT